MKKHLIMTALCVLLTIELPGCSKLMHFPYSFAGAFLPLIC